MLFLHGALQLATFNSTSVKSSKNTLQSVSINSKRLRRRIVTEKPTTDERPSYKALIEVSQCHILHPYILYRMNKELHKLGLYRIYIFFPIRPEPYFQIDCNFTNLMCKMLRTYKWFEFLIIFLCSSYHYIIYTHSQSVCKQNTKSVESLIGKNQLDIPEKVPDSGRSRNPVQP